MRGCQGAPALGKGHAMESCEGEEKWVSWTLERWVRRKGSLWKRILKFLGKMSYAEDAQP